MFWETIPAMPFVLAIVAMLCGPTAVVLIVWLLIRHVGNRRTEQHRERMAMIDKGLLATEMAGDTTNTLSAPERRLMKGITWAAIGMAVTLWFLFMGAGGATFLGLIPLFLGLSWIAFYVVKRLYLPSEETQTESREPEVQAQEEEQTPSEGQKSEVPVQVEEASGASDDTVS